MSDASQSGDALGMREPIDRRDFMNSVLLASGSALLGSLSPSQMLAADDWTGYAGVGDYSRSNGNTHEVITAGHQIRDNVFRKTPPEVIDTGEVFDCVIAGGGISGLAAALRFQRQSPGLQCLILENHPGLAAKPNATNSSWMASISWRRRDPIISASRLQAHSWRSSTIRSAWILRNFRIKAGKARLRGFHSAGHSSSFRSPTASTLAPGSDKARYVAPRSLE